MNIMMWIFFGVFIVTGVIFNFVLYYQDKHHEQNTSFLTSERLLIFIVEILIAVIGFGLTLTITNANERSIEKDKAIQMLEQTIQYTDRQITMEKNYLNMHADGDIDDKGLIDSSVISLQYYNNILSNEVVLQNANMNTYGEIMRYLIWIEDCDKRAEAIYEEEKAAEGTEDTTADTGTEEIGDDGKKPTTKVYNQKYWRWSCLKKTRDLLSICCSELNGDITAEEAAEKCKEIKNLPERGYECITK